MQDNSTVRVPTGEHSRLQRCDDDGYQQVVIVSGDGGSGSADTQETTQVLVKTAVEAINTATGTVSATPAANTILGRLKDLLTFKVATTTLQDAQSSTRNGDLLDVSGYSIAVLQVSGTFIATIYFEASNDDSTWYSINATQIGADALVQSTPAVGLFRLSVAGIKSIRARVVWTSGTSVTVTGRATTADSHAKVVSPINTGHRAQVTITRTADTTSYAIGDAVGLTSAIYETGVIGKANGEFIVTAAHLHLAVAAIPTGMTAGFNLHCFSSTPTAIADNAVIGTTLTTSDLLKRSAKIPIPLPVDEGNYCSAYNDGLNQQVTLSATGTLFVILETLSAFTPTSGAVKYLDIHGTEI